MILIRPRLKMALAATVMALSAAPAAIAEELPGPLETALTEAEANNKLRVSYTQSFEWPGNNPVVERYDAAADEWTLISGDPEALDRKGQKKLKTWKRVESAPGELLYADYRGSLRDATLEEETDETLAYSFNTGQADNADLNEGVEDKVFTRAVVRKEDGSITYYAIKALEGFKPNAVSRLDQFVFEQTFERPAPDVPPVMTKVYWKAVGRQLLSNVDEEYTIYYSDFEVVR